MTKKRTGFTRCWAARLGTVVAAGGLVLQATGTAQAATARSSHKVVTITFWDDNAGPRTPIYEHLIPIFEREYPDIKVDYVGVPETASLEKIEASVAGHATPDTSAVMGSNLSSVIGLNTLMPLNKFYDSSSLKGHLSGPAVKWVAQQSPDGKTLYALPFSADTTVLWCNMKLFTPAHLTCPTTWDAFFTDAVKLTDPSKGIYGFTMRGTAGSTSQLMDEMISYAGLRHFFGSNGKTELASPRALEYLQRFAKLYKTATPSADDTNGYLPMVAEFDSGKIAMMLHNLGSYSTNVAAIGAANLVGNTEPTGPYEKSGAASYAAPGFDTYGIFKQSKHISQDETWLKFLVGEEGNGYWNKIVNQIPTNEKTVSESWLKTRQSAANGLAELSNPKVTLVEEPSYLPQFASIESTMDTEWSEVMLGTKSAASWLDQLASLFDSAEAEWTSSHK